MRYTPIGGAVPLVNIFFGEVILGGVGSGLYGMFFYIVIAVFVAGLMVGRTPEYLGKKIEAREIKFAAIGALFVPDDGAGARGDLGRHALRPRVDLQHRRPRLHRGALRLHSQANNNGSAFAGYGATNFSANLGDDRTEPGRFVPLLAALALGGALADKKIAPDSAGTFRTDGPTFVVLLVGVIVLTAGLMIFPALTLGPIVEGLMH